MKQETRKELVRICGELTKLEFDLKTAAMKDNSVNNCEMIADYISDQRGELEELLEE